MFYRRATESKVNQIGLIAKEIKEGLTWDERLELLKQEKLQKQNESVLKVDKIRFDKRLSEAIRNYNDWCYLLSEGKPSELEIVKRLSVVDFELLRIKFKERHNQDGK